MRWASSPGGSVGTTSTASPSARSASTPTSWSESVTRTRFMIRRRPPLSRLLGQDPLGGADPGPVRDGEAEAGEDALEGGEADDHVGVVDVPQVGEAEELPLHLALAPGDGDVVLGAVGADDGFTVHAGGRDDGGDRRARRGPREERQTERFRARPGGPGEALVAAVDLRWAPRRPEAR